MVPENDGFMKFIKDSIEEIKSLDGDDEAQHGKRDELWRSVLIQLSRPSVYWTRDDMVEYVKAALKTQKIDFEEHCA